jgi:7-carboxy-7-deazaguanine synthase
VAAKMTAESQPIRISEIFGPTIQGEGILIGQPTVFVRTGGCDYRCSWCDTLHAVDGKFRHDWKPMSAKDIFERIQTLSGQKPLTITLSGGNPAIQPLNPLIDLGQAQGYEFALETQGSISQYWFKDLDILTLSPKPPSSGENTDLNKLDQCVRAAGKNTKVNLKIVIFDDKDYTYAQDISARYPDLPITLQPGNHQVSGEADTSALITRLEWLVGKVTADRWYTTSVLPQLHVLIWGNKKGV